MTDLKTPQEQVGEFMEMSGITAHDLGKWLEQMNWIKRRFFDWTDIPNELALKVLNARHAIAEQVRKDLPDANSLPPTDMD